MEIPKNYFIYARKSSESEDRQMASIDSQIKELQSIAKRNNLNVIEIFSESASAKAPGRPIFNEMLTRIEGGEAPGILCWKLNRLARNPIDGGRVSWLLQNGIIQHIYTHGKSYLPNDNVIVMAVELGMANQFIRDLSTDTKRGLQAKAERGYYPGPAPLGYMHNPMKRKGEKEIIIDEEKFDLVRKAFDLMLTGKYRPDEVRKIAYKKWGLTGNGGKMVPRSTIYSMFNNPFYYGEYEYPAKSGKWYKGKHKAMITKEEFGILRKFLGDKSTTRAQKYEFKYRGPILCGECGCLITAEHKVKRQKNGNVHRYIYYHCTKRKEDVDCSQPSIRETELEKQLLQSLERVSIPSEFSAWAKDVLKEKHKGEIAQRDLVLKNQRIAYDKVLKKIDGIIDMRANNELSEAEFASKKALLTEEKERLHKILNGADERATDWLETAEKLFNFAETVKETFDNGDMKIKKDILHTLGSNLYLKDGKVSISLTKPLQLIEKCSGVVREIHSKFEPPKEVEKQGFYAEKYASNPVLLRG